MRTYLLLLLFSFTIACKSQSVNQKFEKVDQYIFKIGALKNFNLATIADTITSIFDSKEMKSRAIFSWIAGNIALNPKSTRNNESKNSEPETTIASEMLHHLEWLNYFKKWQVWRVSDV